MGSLFIVVFGNCEGRGVGLLNVQYDVCLYVVLRMVGLYYFVGEGMNFFFDKIVFFIVVDVVVQGCGF